MRPETFPPQPCLRNCRHLRLGATAFMMMWFCVVFPYAMSLVPPRWQGTMSGSVTLSVGLTASLVSLAGGYIIEAAGFRSLYLIFAAVTVIGVVIFWLYFRGRRGEPLTEAS